LSTTLNDLAHRLALLAGPCGCTITVRLLGGPHGNVVELKASRVSAAEAREYTRQLTLRALASRGAAELAAEFMREARLAFASDRPRRAGARQLRL
jgi:surface antigen